MSGKRFKTEEIVRHLREADAMLSQGINVAGATRTTGANKSTFYRWRREFSGMKVDQERHMKDIERVKIRLKKLVADLSLDNSILQETTLGNF